MGDDDRRPDALDELAALRARLTELQAEAQEANRLRAELSLFRELVQESRGLMCVHDLEGNLLFVNAAAAAALGFQADDGVGWNLRRFLAPAVEQEFDAYLAKIRHAPVDEGLLRLAAKDGSEQIWLYRNVRFEAPGMPTRVLGHAQDVTALMKAERALRETRAALADLVAHRTADLRDTEARFHAEMEHRHQIERADAGARRIESVGTLAGGVAHEFNNLLTVILGQTQLLLATLGPEAAGFRRPLELVHRATDRATELTRQLLAVGRRQSLRPRVVDVNALLENFLPALRRVVGAAITVTLRRALELEPVRVDPPQLEYILHVLATNAREAMPDGGTLMLATQRVVLDEAFVESHPGARAGPHAQITVADTGTGMDESTRARVFEPFFAAGTRGRGTGLELAAVYGMVKQHDGYIEVESERGRGDAFRIYLPLVERAPSSTGEGWPAPQRATPPAAIALPADGRAATETVLLVDDDDGVRSLVRVVLEREGYTVLEAGDAPTALGIAERHLEPIHLLLTDVVMPGMNGRELARRLTADHPTLRVLYMSGFPGVAGDAPDLLDPGAAFVAKPFTLTTLVERLRAVLED